MEKGEGGGDLLSLAGNHDFVFVEIWCEGTAACEECSSVGVLDGFFECAFGVTGGIREGENDRVWIQVGHCLEDPFVEDPTHG